MLHKAVFCWNFQTVDVLQRPFTGFNSQCTKTRVLSVNQAKTQVGVKVQVAQLVTNTFMNKGEVPCMRQDRAIGL